MKNIFSLFLSTVTAILSIFGIGPNGSYYTPIDNCNGGDPFIVETQSGTYYTYTTGGGIDIIKISNFDDTEIIDKKTVFYAGEHGTLKDIWAPEIHNINGKWYIISCALFSKDAVFEGKMPEATEPSDNDDYYRYCFVLESKTDNIFGEYEFKSILSPNGMNNIDGTYLQYDNKLYFVTSSYKDVAHQCITVTEMLDPYTLKTDSNGNTVTSELSTPEFNWEKQGWKVNEGPAVLYKNDKIYIIYSASGFSSGGYCMGMLTFIGNDIMDTCHWIKSPVPVHFNDPLNDIYNAGHCSFLYRDNGDIYMVYHATSTKEFSDSPRLTYIKKVNFIGNAPIFK